eukprot:scaffold22468_cov68-Phaeocystis_antarctica.AAC.1
MQHRARLGVSGDAVREAGSGTLAEVVVRHGRRDGGREEVWLAVLVIPHLGRGRGHDRVAHGVRDGVGARVLARREARAAVLVVKLVDGCARGLQWVELLGNREPFAHSGKDRGGVAVRVNVPVRRPVCVLTGDHCRVRPRSRESVAREIEGHALVVQPEVDRIGNLDAAARPRAGRHQVGCRHPRSPAARLPRPLRSISVHDGHAQLLEHHQHRVLFGSFGEAADVAIGRGCSVGQVGSQCAHTPQLSGVCHGLEGLNFGAEGRLVVGCGRLDAAHAQRARQLFEALDDLDETPVQRVFRGVGVRQADDWDALIGSRGLHLISPSTVANVRPFKNEVGPAICIKKGVIKVCAISVFRRAVGGEVEHLGQHGLLLRRWVRWKQGRIVRCVCVVAKVSRRIASVVVAVQVGA